MKFKSDYYKETGIESLIFSYGFKEGIVENKDNLKGNTFENQKYNNNILPISMNPIDYGRIIIQNPLSLGVNYIIQNDNGLTINFNNFEKFNEVEFFKNGISLIKFTDNFINKSRFIREIDNKKFLFENGKEILFTNKLKTKFISKISKDKILISKFLTLDIETYTKNGILIPYLISFYDGQKPYSF
jgi:hypothetical protein